MAVPPFEVLSPTELRRRDGLKWRRFGPDVLPLWVAEMDVLPAPEVVEALVTAARTGGTGYPAVGHGYGEALAEFAEARWSWSPNPADTATCADVMVGIRILVELLVPPGAPVLIPSPVYPPFMEFTEEVGRRIVPVPLTQAGRLDAEAIDAALADATRSGPAGSLILLCNPQNPTGTVHTHAELSAVAQVADRRGATVVADEVHGPLVPPGARFVPWLSVSPRGFAVTSAAKAFNLAGAKAALIVAGPESRRALRGLPPSVKYSAGHLGVLSHSAAYRSDPAWLDGVNANISANRELLASLLAARIPGIGYRIPEATYLAWLDCRALGLGEDPARHFLRRGRVALAQGPPFGPGGAGHARLNLACSAAVLTEAVDRMASAASPG
jgi:cystathionine beta-lyase